MDVANRARAYAYMLGVLKNREGDSFCRTCSAFQSTLAAVQDNLAAFEQEHAAEIEKLPGEHSLFFAVARSGIRAMKLPEHPVRQKKEGNCRLPEGVCFLKSSMAILRQL